MLLGEIILKYRKENHISQNAFAAKCSEIAKAHGMKKGVSNGYVSMLENDNNPKSGKGIVPSFQTYLICAEAMGMSFDTLQSMLDPESPISSETMARQTEAFDLEEKKARAEKISDIIRLANYLDTDDLDSVQRIVASLVSKKE